MVLEKLCKENHVLEGPSYMKIFLTLVISSGVASN